MNQIKTLTHQNKKYKYIFCDIHGLINFFRSDILLMENFEKLLKVHRPGDIEFKYTKILNEDLQNYYDMINWYNNKMLNDGKILIICFVNFALSFVTLSPSHNSKWPPLLSFQFKLKYIPKVTCFLSPFSG